MADNTGCHNTDDSVPKQVGIIVGSTRPNCIGKHIASWVHQLLWQHNTGGASAGVCYTFLDLAEWNLPLFDEPGIPARHPPVHDHTKAWQAKISSLSGFIFVTPQYNWGYPAALKNAIDYLYHEWKGKPAAIISYGTRGGGKAAEQLKQVLTGLRMSIMSTMPALILTEEQILAGVTDNDISQHFSPQAGEIWNVAGQLAEALSGDIAAQLQAR